MPPIELQTDWFQRECNIALLTTGLVVFDCDDPAQAALVIEKCGDTPHKVKTPRGGIHLGYRRRQGIQLANQVKIKGLDIDIRTDGGLELIPNSESDQGRYEWLGPGLVPISALPVARVGWTRERAQKRAPIICPGLNGSERTRRARSYIANILSVSGHRGHDACYRAACKCRDFGLNAEETLRLLLEWNETNAMPPWSNAELLHKVDSVFKPRRVR